jgi:hypothetical protein
MATGLRLASAAWELAPDSRRNPANTASTRVIRPFSAGPRRATVLSS